MDLPHNRMWGSSTAGEAWCQCSLNMVCHVHPNPLHDNIEIVLERLSRWLDSPHNNLNVIAEPKHMCWRVWWNTCVGRVAFKSSLWIVHRIQYRRSGLQLTGASLLILRTILQEAASGLAELRDTDVQLRVLSLENTKALAELQNDLFYIESLIRSCLAREANTARLDLAQQIWSFQTQTVCKFVHHIDLPMAGI